MVRHGFVIFHVKLNNYALVLISAFHSEGNFVLKQIQDFTFLKLYIDMYIFNNISVYRAVKKHNAHLIEIKCRK